MQDEHVEYNFRWSVYMVVYDENFLPKFHSEKQKHIFNFFSAWNVQQNMYILYAHVYVHKNWSFARLK